MLPVRCAMLSLALLIAGCSTPPPNFPGPPVAGKPPEPMRPAPMNPAPAPPGPESPTAPAIPAPVPAPAPTGQLQVGGVYASRPKSEGLLPGPYVITKILAIEGEVLQARPYEGTVIELPKTIDTAKLTFFLPRQPMSRAGFLAEKPVLIAVEKLTDEEREALK